MLIRVVLPAPFSPITPMDLAALGREVDAVVGDKAAEALDDPERRDLRHDVGYLAVIGSAIVIAPSTI